MLLQDTNETKAAGTESFGRFLELCDGMIAIVSKEYFTRLWCVYELATFCKNNRESLDERLLLLSIAWPPVFSPLKSRTLTREELDWFEGFDCLEARRSASNRCAASGVLSARPCPLPPPPAHQQVRCSKPADRAFVLDAIRNNWGSEEEFNHFVRTDLPQIFQLSKHRYSRQLGHTMGQAFDLAFGG